MTCSIGEEVSRTPVKSFASATNAKSVLLYGV